MIEMKCPHCGHELRIADEYAGKRGGCKHCKGVFTVSMPGPPARDQQVRPALDALQAMPDAGAHRPGPKAVPDQAYKPLGALYWLAVVLVTPVALVWGLVLRKGHPQKGMAVLIPLALIVVGIAGSVAWIATVGSAGQQVDSTGQTRAAAGEDRPVAAPVASAEQAQEAARAAGSARHETAPPAAGMPIPPAEEAGIREAIQRVVDASARGDYNTLRQFITEDCTLSMLGGEGTSYWKYATPEALASSAGQGIVSTLESVKVLEYNGDTVKVDFKESGSGPGVWTKSTTTATLRKESGVWRIDAFVAIDATSGTGKPSEITGEAKVDAAVLGQYVPAYPGVPFGPADPARVKLPTFVEEEFATCVSGVTQDAPEKVRDFYVEQLKAHGWRRVSGSVSTRTGVNGRTEKSSIVKGTRPGPNGAHLLEIAVAIRTTPGGSEISVAMGPTDRGRNSLASRGEAVTLGMDDLGPETMVPPAAMGEYVTAFPGVQFDVIDAATAPVPSFVSANRATCVAGVTPQSIDAVLAFYRQDLQGRGWRLTGAGNDVFELPEVGWVGTDSLSAKLPLPNADYDIYVEVTLHEYGQGTRIIVCLGPS